MLFPLSWQKVAIKICLVWLGAFFLTSTYQMYPSRQIYYDRIFKPASTQKRNFVETAMNTSIDDPWDYQPITNLCASTTWREGLTFICGAPDGGVGNLKNTLVSCIRWAIQGGGNSKSVVLFLRSLLMLTSWFGDSKDHEKRRQ